MKRKIVGIITGIMIFALVGCATIMTGTSQNINFSSNPTGAKVKINGMMMGQTPTVLKLDSDKEHQVKIELDGYLAYETKITRSISGWFWGNILFGGIVGIVVDFASGGIYKLDVEQISVELDKNGMGALGNNQEGDVYVFVSLNPDPSWEKIAQLEAE